MVYNETESVIFRHFFRLAKTLITERSFRLDKEPLRHLFGAVRPSGGRAVPLSDPAAPPGAGSRAVSHLQRARRTQGGSVYAFRMRARRGGAGLHRVRACRIRRRRACRADGRVARGGDLLRGFSQACAAGAIRAVRILLRLLKAYEEYNQSGRLGKRVSFLCFAGYSCIQRRKAPENPANMNNL